MESHGITEFEEIPSNSLDEYYEQIVELGNINYSIKKPAIAIHSIPKKDILPQQEYVSSPKWKQVKTESHKRSSFPLPKKAQITKQSVKSVKKSGPSQPNGHSNLKLKEMVNIQNVLEIA